MSDLNRDGVEDNRTVERTTVVTTDRKDFSRYRIHGRNLIRTLMPPIR